MKYFKKIQIPGWEILKEKYNHYISFYETKLFLKLPQSDIPFLEKLILPEIEKQFKTNTFISEAFLFFMKENHNRGMHVDGHILDRSTTYNWGLNFPILNCDESEMKWYDGDYELYPTSSPNGARYLGINWKNTPNEVDSTIINQPTLVYVNIPHTVINYSNNPRLLLSVRFRPDLFDGKLIDLDTETL
jgi:hypothetical protein